MSKARRVEFRIVKMLCEYQLPENISETELNKLIDDINNPDEIELPRTVLNIDMDHTQLLSIVINEDEQGKPCEISDAFGFMSQSLIDRFPLEDLAYNLALEDMKENYASEIRQYPDFMQSSAFIMRVDERKSWYILRMTNTLNTMFENQTPKAT